MHYPSLFIDPSDEAIQVILFSANTIDTLTWHVDKDLTNSLLLKIDEVLKRNAITYLDLKKVIVCTGPGSYTSLRISLATLNTAHYVTKIPLFGFTAFELEVFALLESIIIDTVSSLPSSLFLRCTLLSRFGDPLVRSFFVKKDEEGIQLNEATIQQLEGVKIPLLYNEGFAIIPKELDKAVNKGIISDVETMKQSFVQKVLLTEKPVITFTSIQPSETLLPLYYRGPKITLRTTKKSGKDAI
jgi:hypothetical protein